MWSIEVYKQNENDARLSLTLGLLPNGWLYKMDLPADWKILHE